MADEPAAAAPGSPRCGFVALIGAPNAGKSTLTNALVGSKVAIVTPKVQTTRTLVRGIAIEGAAQLVLVDTPGIFAPRRRLDRAMVATAWGGAQDADIVALLIDAKRGLDDEVECDPRQARRCRPAEGAGAQQDRSRGEGDAARAGAGRQRPGGLCRDLHGVGASGDGVEDLRRWLAAHVPEGPWHYPADEVSDAPLRQLAAEITREKLYLKLHQELPYRSTVETETWTERSDGSVRIEQTIYVERESQRKIVLGKAGQTIKAIGAAARKELAGILEQPVHLFLFVKVREDWGDDPERYRQMGLEFPKE